MVDKTRLEVLASKTSTLNALADSLNEKIAALETTLSAMHVGIAVWLDDLLLVAEGCTENEDTGEKTEYGFHLGYTKIANVWRIAVRRVEMKEVREEYSNIPSWELSDVVQTLPLLQASRQVRAEAAGHFDHLIGALSRKADEYIANIEKASKLAE